MVALLIIHFCLLTLSSLLASALAPILPPDGHGTIRGRWIVTLVSGLTIEQFEEHLSWVREISNLPPRHPGEPILDDAFDLGDLKCYSGSFSIEMIHQIRNRTDVALIEPDLEANAASDFPGAPTTTSLATSWQSQYFSTSVQSTDPTAVQSNAPWGLARISTRENPFLSPDSSADYRYDARAGIDTYAYVLDSGLYAQHTEFEGRATFAINLADRRFQDDEDRFGHGTWVAGIIGSRTYGVAKKTNIVGVKVITNAQSLNLESRIIAGLSWVKDDITRHGRERVSVINMSLNVRTKAIGLAIKALQDIGVFVGLSAGNSKEYIAADSVRATACTAGATEMDDMPWSRSNYGPGVSIYAPGVDIKSTGTLDAIASSIRSGTSASAPFVVGMAAYLISTKGPRPPKELCDMIKGMASRDQIFKPVKGQGAEPNLLLYNGIGL